MKTSRVAGVGLAAVTALMTLAALPSPRSSTTAAAEKCAKCMDYNHCSWFDPPVGRNTNCTNFPCEYTGEDCGAVTLYFNPNVERREMRTRNGGFIRLVGVDDGLFASYSCDHELIAVAREAAPGELQLVDTGPFQRNLSWGRVSAQLLEQ